MQLRTVLILLLLVGSANGHLGMILGLVGKIVGGIIKMDMQIFGPMAMKGFQTMLGMIMNGFGGLGGQFGGNGQVGGQFGGNGQIGGGFNGGGQAGGQFGGNGQTGGGLNGGGQAQNGGGFGFGFGSNGGANNGANSNGGFGFGFGSNGGANNGANSNGGFGFGLGGNGQTGGKGNGGLGGIFGFGGNGGANAGANGAANAGGGFLDSLVSGLRGILKQYAGIAGGLIGGSKSWAETVQGLIQAGFGNFFKIFGGLAASSQAAISGLIAQTLEVFTTVLKLKMGGLMSLDSLIQTEIKVIKSILEKAGSNMNGIVGSLGAQAPQISGSIGFGFKMAKEQYKKGYKKLDAPTRQGLDKMMAALAETRSKIGKMIKSATPKHKTDMGVLFHVIKNTHAVSMTVN